MYSPKIEPNPTVTADSGSQAMCFFSRVAPTTMETITAKAMGMTRNCAMDCSSSSISSTSSSAVPSSPGSCLCASLTVLRILRTRLLCFLFPRKLNCSAPKAELVCPKLALIARLRGLLCVEIFAADTLPSEDTRLACSLCAGLAGEGWPDLESLPCVPANSNVCCVCSSSIASSSSALQEAPSSPLPECTRKISEEHARKIRMDRMLKEKVGRVFSRELVQYTKLKNAAEAA
mmetsp:Transcript_56667/g.98741  ORF Transcript_56667/g.98741 Transcript_56667/m.98741 type:complete len:233 (-) Transcript_56667:7-705(-)